MSLITHANCLNFRKNVKRLVSHGAVSVSQKQEKLALENQMEVYETLLTVQQDRFVSVNKKLWVLE